MARRRTRRTTKERDYTGQHRRLKEHWRPTVDAGRAWCHAAICKKPSRWIQPGTPWDLGHTPDRTGWTGPEHEACNRSEGATRGNRRRGPVRMVTILNTSRRW